MSTHLCLAGVDADATALDWSMTDHRDDEHSVMDYTWMSLPGGAYGTVAVPQEGLGEIVWNVWDERGLYVASGRASDARSARLRVEALLAERNAR